MWSDRDLLDVEARTRAASEQLGDEIVALPTPPPLWDDIQLDRARLTGDSFDVLATEPIDEEDKAQSPCSGELMSVEEIAQRQAFVRFPVLVIVYFWSNTGGGTRKASFLVRN